MLLRPQGAPGGPREGKAYIPHCGISHGMQSVRGNTKQDCEKLAPKGDEYEGCFKKCVKKCAEECEALKKYMPTELPLGLLTAGFIGACYDSCESKCEEKCVMEAGDTERARELCCRKLCYDSVEAYTDPECVATCMKDEKDPCKAWKEKERESNLEELCRMYDIC